LEKGGRGGGGVEGRFNCGSSVNRLLGGGGILLGVH
jgi:hypothetical protein